MTDVQEVEHIIAKELSIYTRRGRIGPDSVATKIRTALSASDYVIVKRNQVIRIPDGTPEKDQPKTLPLHLNNDISVNPVVDAALVFAAKFYHEGYDEGYDEGLASGAENIKKDTLEARIEALKDAMNHAYAGINRIAADINKLEREDESHGNSS